MKKYSFILLLLLSTAARSQDSTAAKRMPIDGSYQKNSYMATLSVGFINSYRSEYSVPATFEKGNTTGFAPVHGRFEYGVSNRVSMALNASYNAIYFNSFRLYTGYNGPIKRSSINRFRVMSAGISAYYHLGHIIRVKHLDPFVGAGLCLNNIVESAYPQGDSTFVRKHHTATPVLKAGARYYISDKVSVFADAGYDKLSFVSIGFSCRFLPVKK